MGTEDGHELRKQKAIAEQYLRIHTLDAQDMVAAGGAQTLHEAAAERRSPS